MDSVIVIKIISSFAYPVGLTVFAGLCSWLFRCFDYRRLSQFSVLIMVSVFLLSSNPIASALLASNLESQYPQSAMTEINQHEAIIVLGGGLRVPLKPAKHVQIGAASDRYLYALRLYNAGKAPKIILSGGNLVKQTDLKGEAYYAKQLLEQWGIPSEVILIEDQSRTTTENKHLVEVLLAEQGIESALLVTSALHMPRAYSLFKTLPIVVTPASADVIVREAQWSFWLNMLPSASAIGLTTRALHEYYGAFYNRLKNFVTKLSQPA